MKNPQVHDEVVPPSVTESDIESDFTSHACENVSTAIRSSWGPPNQLGLPENYEKYYGCQLSSPPKERGEDGKIGRL